MVEADANYVAFQGPNDCLALYRRYALTSRVWCEGGLGFVTVSCVCPGSQHHSRKEQLFPWLHGSALSCMGIYMRLALLLATSFSSGLFVEPLADATLSVTVAL